MEEVQQSTKFAKILELILLIGNFLNTGTRNEQTLGFEFGFIAKVWRRVFTVINFSVCVIERCYGQAYAVTGGIWVFIPPKSAQVNFLCGKNDVRTAIQQLYTPQKALYPPKQISDYAPASAPTLSRITGGAMFCRNCPGSKVSRLFVDLMPKCLVPRFWQRSVLRWCWSVSCGSRVSWCQSFLWPKCPVTTTAMKTWKINGVLLRNRQIHGEFTVMPSTENMVVAVMVCGCHCWIPLWTVCRKCYYSAHKLRLHGANASMAKNLWRRCPKVTLHRNFVM